MGEPDVDESILTIPRRFGGATIVYPVSTLPLVDIIISELLGEHCTPDIWHKFALAYYRLKRFDDFERILEEGIAFAKKENTGRDTSVLKFHDSITSYQILRGCNEGDKVRRSQYFSRAMEHLNQGDEISKYDTNHILQRGFYLLYNDQKLDHAEAQFKFITNTNEDHILALVGYACVFYNKKDYSKSLQLFKKVLKVRPKCPAYIRLGIGYCLLKLGYVKKARVAFERVLELEENNSYAMTALSVLDFNEGTLESTTAGANRLIKSWKVDPTNTSTALELADFLFLRGNYDKSEKYSRIAFQLAESPILKGRSHYLVGRFHHHKGEIELAIKHYNIAVATCSPDFINPLFGLGQLYAKKKDFEKAIDYFEKILTTAPDNAETKKGLIMMYIRSPGKDAATRDKRTASVKQYFSELLVNENLNDPTLVVEHARFVEKTNLPLALKETSRVIDMYKDSEGTKVPIELLNNYGVYLYMNKVFPEANTIFTQCLSRVEKECWQDNLYADSLELTLTFNLARTNEELGYTDKSVELYKRLLKWNPDYNEGNLRLGKLAEKRSDYKAATTHYQKVLSNDPHNIDALAALGCLFMKKRNFLEAQKKFEAILKFPEHKDNAYPYLALGVIWLEQLYKPNRNKEKDEENMSRAFEMFQKVLRNHPKNVYAGNCMGILLTFIGSYEEARECFSEVREALFDEKGPWLNLAYVYGLLKNYLNAIRMYKAAIEKFGLDTDSDVLLALGRMYWKVEDYNNALDCMLQAVQHDSLNLYAKYNVAKIYSKLGLRVMESPNQSLFDLDQAISYFEEAKLTFDDIHGSMKSSSDMKIKWKHINMDHLTEEHSKSEDYLIQANSKRPQIVEIERAREENRRKQREIMLKLEEEKIAQMKIQESQNLERQNRLRDLRNEFLNMNKDALKVPVKDDKRKSGGKSGSAKNKKDDDMEGFIASDNECFEKSGRKKKLKRNRRNRRKVEPSENEDDDKKGEEQNTTFEVSYRSKKNTFIFTPNDGENNKAGGRCKMEESMSSQDPVDTVFGPCSDDSLRSSSSD
uniref:RNA polymerase-associated protein Ctr9 homolog (inferred by orthology to a zebrafish protein) n=1 Tax=Strongyloides venezuelensis TaxID=75913 RepID=A0A0K0FP45_STRVS